MIKIYTSYFSGIRKYNLPIHECVSIAIYPPKGVAVPSFPQLFPTSSILRAYKNMVISDQQYETRYKEEVLSKLNPSEVAKKLAGKVLLCYEKPENFCHRHIVAAWLAENGCAIVEEIHDERYITIEQ